MNKSLIMLTILLLISGLISAQAESEEKFQAKYYENAKVIRIKHSEGEAFVDRNYDEGLEEATANLPVFENDAVQTTDGRLELYLGRLNYLRLDFDTRVMLEKIPSLRKTSLAIKIFNGGISFDISSLDYERDIEIQTPDCGIFILEKGTFRINVTPEKGTEILVKNGVAEISGSDSSRDLRSGQRTVFLDGKVSERPYFFRTWPQDDFEFWCKQRNLKTGTARFSSSRYLDDGYQDYEYELSRNGRWRFSSTYNSYVWLPYSISGTWRPYYNGRWISHPHYGSVWVSYDPWGWFTHHYGRWHWDTFYGWHWIPGYRWSPAWVAWFADDYYYGWAPLSYWNRPIIVMNRRWRRNYRYWKGIPVHSMSTIVIRKDHLNVSHINRHALHITDQKKLTNRSLRFTRKPPLLKNRPHTVRLINAKGKTVLVKKSGLASGSRYQTLKNGIISRRAVKNPKVVNRYSGGTRRVIATRRFTPPRKKTGGTKTVTRTSSEYTTVRTRKKTATQTRKPVKKKAVKKRKKSPGFVFSSRSPRATVSEAGASQNSGNRASSGSRKTVPSQKAVSGTGRYVPRSSGSVKTPDNLARYQRKINSAFSYRSRAGNYPRSSTYSPKTYTPSKRYNSGTYSSKKSYRPRTYSVKKSSRSSSRSASARSAKSKSGSSKRSKRK